MTQRFWDNLSVVVLAIVATTGGTYFGMREGRAEMKRWQDSYYAKQRVVEGFVTIPISDWQYLVKQSFHPVVAPAPPKKAKPAKRSLLGKYECGDSGHELCVAGMVYGYKP